MMLLRPYQERLVSQVCQALSEHGNTLAVGPTGSGKCLGRGTPVLMFDGTTKPVEDVRVGEQLMGPDSLPRLVVSLAQGKEELFKVIPKKGEAYVVNRSHILSLKISGNDNVAGHKPGTVVNISVDDYLRQHKTFHHCAKGWRAYVNFPANNHTLPIPPYILGVWLGDGSSTPGNSFTCPVDKNEILRELSRYAESIGYRLRYSDNTEKCPMAFITHGDKTPHNIFTKQLRINNLLGNKHIPHIYKTATRHDRLELLAGLMDTDGSLANGGYDFISRDKQLSLDVVFLARSLGLAAYFNVSMKKAQSMQEAREHYRVSISGDCSIIPCRVARKRASVRKQAKDVLRTGIKLEPLGIGEYFGFEISGSDRLFLLGDFTVTHNTLMLSEVARRHGGKTLVLQHRDELVSQNIKTWNTVNPRAAISLFTAGQKSWRGNATFAMAPTLSRADNLKTIPKLDLFIIDEAHHAVADSYMRIVEAVKEKNPDCHIAGFTATPNRGDGKGLRPVFNNCAGQITLEELVTLGFLVKPRAFVCKLAGVPEQLDKVGLKGGEYDMASVEAIMNSTINNQTIVQQWREQAGGRRTIVFCSTVSHARDIAKAFVDAGIKAATVEGDMPAAERAANLQALENGNLQVLCNVAVLTEGFDCPPVSCVVLLRPCSHKSTMLQMIGRGLRILDASKYPGQVKTDCLILDFGTSLLNHGSLNTVVDLDDRTKTCATCGSLIPMPCKQCPICGADCIAIGPGGGAAEGIGGDGEAGQVSLTEIDIINMSPFKWMDIFDTGKVWMACGFNACVCVATSNRNNWTAIGKLKGQPARALQVGEKIPAFASADDFMRNYENDDAAKKSKTWLNHPASWKQMEHLNRLGYPTATDFNWTKYKAVCALNFGWNQTAIERLLFSND